MTNQTKQGVIIVDSIDGEEINVRKNIYADSASELDSVAYLAESMCMHLSGIEYALERIIMLNRTLTPILKSHAEPTMNDVAGNLNGDTNEN